MLIDITLILLYTRRTYKGIIRYKWPYIKRHSWFQKGDHDMSDNPIYTSESTVKSIWQEYRIYDNRLEFDTQFGMMTVPFEHIESVEILTSDVSGLLQGDLRLKNFRPSIKLDWANFLEHIVLDKSKGYVRRLLFTPDDLEAFKSALDGALARYRENK